MNNAGASLSGAVEEVSAAEAKALLDINLVTPAVVSSLCAARACAAWAAVASS